MSEKTTEIYYVTKYGLTEGIWEVAAGEAHFSDDKKYLYLDVLSGSGFPSLPVQVKEGDFHRSVGAAWLRINQLKEAKLRSLEKSMKKLHDHKTEITPWKKGL